MDSVGENQDVLLRSKAEILGILVEIAQGQDQIGILAQGMEEADSIQHRLHILSISYIADDFTLREIGKAQ